MRQPDKIAIAYVSLAVPNNPQFCNPGLNTNGNIFMHNVLFGLRADGSSHVEAFSAVPVPSFPRSPRVIVPTQRLDLAPGITATGVPFVNITPLKQLTMGLSMAWHLVGWGIRSRGSQHRIIFSYNISVPPLAFTLAAAFLTSATLLTFIGDLYVPGETVPGTILYKLDWWLGRKLLKYVRGAVVVADRIATDYLPGRSYIRVDGGVSRSMIEESGRLLAARCFDSSSFTIVATGFLSAYNGFRDILAAFSQMKGSQYRLILAGRGPLEGEIVAATRTDPRIDFKGFLEIQDLLALHASADVLVSMRLTQSFKTAYAFPSKTFEYLLSGVPVVTTATGHMKDEYGSYCFVLEEESPHALAALLQRIERLAPAERECIGCAARQFIVDHKTWELQHRRIAEYVRSTATTRN